MNEQEVRLGEVTLCFDEQGDPADPMVLLIMGLGLDLCWWRDDFCAQLAERGFRVVRFDNRDVGRSTHFLGSGPSGWQLLRRKSNPVYCLGDMADDAGALIAHLDPAGAHVVGVSMGSLVAQEVAIRHPARTHSLVSIMGRPGKTFRRIGSLDRSEEDDEDARVALRRSAAREIGDGMGSGRQLAAILAERDRTADLGRVQAPALVIHGQRDRVIQPSGGRATAVALPDAELLELERMGHDLPRWTWPAVIDGISRTAARAGSG